MNYEFLGSVIIACAVGHMTSAPIGWLTLGICFVVLGILNAFVGTEE